MTWISVKNQLPEKGHVIDIWVTVHATGGYRVTDVTCLGSGYEDSKGIYYCRDEVTHWRYPPAPPQN